VHKVGDQFSAESSYLCSDFLSIINKSSLMRSQCVCARVCLSVFQLTRGRISRNLLWR